MPQEVINLLELANIKIKGKEVSILEIKEKSQNLEFKFSTEHSLAGEDLIQLSKKYNNLKFVASNEPRIELVVTNLADEEKISLIIDLLEDIAVTSNH